MAKQDSKIRLLLDEAMPSKKLLRLNKRSNFNIKHIKEIYKMGGMTDKEVLRLAVQQNRVLVTLDYFFIKESQIQRNNAVVKISGVKNDLHTMNKRLSNLGEYYKKTEDFMGKLITITSNEIKEVDYEGKRKTIKIS